MMNSTEGWTTLIIQDVEYVSRIRYFIFNNTNNEPVNRLVLVFIYTDDGVHSTAAFSYPWMFHVHLFLLMSLSCFVTRQTMLMHTQITYKGKCFLNFSSDLLGNMK